MKGTARNEQNTNKGEHNIKYQKISGGYVKHNNLLWCGVSKGGLHVSALFYKAIVRSDMVETIEEQLQC